MNSGLEPSTEEHSKAAELGGRDGASGVARVAHRPLKNEIVPY